MVCAKHQEVHAKIKVSSELNVHQTEIIVASNMLVFDDETDVNLRSY